MSDAPEISHVYHTEFRMIVQSDVPLTDAEVREQALELIGSEREHFHFVHDETEL